MTYQASIETTNRLYRHAGLGQAGDVPGRWIVDCTSPGARAEGCDEALADVMSGLAQLNHELNGQVPSASHAGANELPRRLVYAVSEVIRMLRDASGNDALVVEIAWSAVLAGDIDDLHQHLRDELKGRNLWLSGAPDTEPSH